MPSLKQRTRCAWLKSRGCRSIPGCHLDLSGSSRTRRRPHAQSHPARCASPSVVRSSRRRDVLVNIGCGPFGKDGWVNLDLFPASGVTLRVDARWGLPLGRRRGARHPCRALLRASRDRRRERPRFLADCRRCLQPGGILRIVVPDMSKYIEAYLAPGWDSAEHTCGCGGERPQDAFAHQDRSAEPRLRCRTASTMAASMPSICARTLQMADFDDIEQVGWRTGRFPGGAIDRDQHATLFALHGGAPLMRLLLTADPEIEVPPRLYGGIERIVDVLVRRLQAAAIRSDWSRVHGLDLSGGCFFSLARPALAVEDRHAARTAGPCGRPSATSGPTSCTASRASLTCCRICADRCRWSCRSSAIRRRAPSASRPSSPRRAC